MKNNQLENESVIEVAIFVFCVLTTLAFGQAFYVFVFSKAVGATSVALVDDKHCPKTAVILCLRGIDPFLKDCLVATFQFDYPDFVVHIIVDHPEDRALSTVRELASGLKHVQIHILENPKPTCSLKCSCILQVVSQLDSSYSVVALLDADTIPQQTWLRSLVTDLQDPGVGAVTGSRWYMPDDSCWGSLVRYQWNSAAVVQMHWYKIAWGGTLAIKTQVLQEAGLLDHWSRAFCEDTMLYSALKKIGMNLGQCPGLLLVNRESCNLRDFYRWVVRQLLTSRLYHPRWWLVVGHAASTTLAIGCAIVVIVVAAIQQQTMASLCVLTGLLLYQTVNCLLLASLEFVVRRRLEVRNEPPHWISFGKLIRLSISLPITQVLYFAAVCNVIFLKSVNWRGIRYEIKGPWDIRMSEYQPYDSNDGRNQSESL